MWNISVLNDSSVQTRWFQNDRQERKFVQKAGFWIFIFITKVQCSFNFIDKGFIFECIILIYSCELNGWSLCSHPFWTHSAAWHGNRTLSEESWIEIHGMYKIDIDGLVRDLKTDGWWRRIARCLLLLTRIECLKFPYTVAVMHEPIKLKYFNWIVLDRIGSFSVTALSCLQWCCRLPSFLYMKSISHGKWSRAFTIIFSVL